MDTETLDTMSLIGDLAWILLLGAIATIIFKKLKQPVVLGYILAGFLASPKFVWLPSISDLANIDFWAEIGIVVLMFSLGLEFSFKKLMESGSSAVLSALIIIMGMTFAGFGVGKLLHLNTINCIFLGGMISMSSTTIILKALNDLGLRQRKFASLVLSVLIIEDLFAVLMLVLLSSLAGGRFEGSELLMSLGKLVFFLIIWFVVGVYVLPSLLQRNRAMLNGETLLVISMALCFGMAFVAVLSGFSLELGAFVMGSLLAGTMMAERIERVITPVKDLFGSVFFISVGMMVDPMVIGQYWGEILLLAVVVIVGMFIFGTAGMLLTGQSLRVAMESGFSLTQIGEFSFIIASLGMGLGVLEESLYPIIVAVSVITIFTTPYFIKLSQPAYRFVERHLPASLRFLIDRYSTQAGDADEQRKLWKVVLGRVIWRILLYSVILIAIILVARHFMIPFFTETFHEWGRLIGVAITLAAMAPFLVALTFPATRKSEKTQIHASSSFIEVPLVVMRVVRYIIALEFIVWFINSYYGLLIGWCVGILAFVVIMVVASSALKKYYRNIEQRFIDNLNIREDMRYGRRNNIVDDLHQAYIEVGPWCRFIGDRLEDTDLRSKYGVSISAVYRGNVTMPLPSHLTRIFPGDTLGVIGTDDQIRRLNEDIEADRREYESKTPSTAKVALRNIVLTGSSPLIEKELSTLHLRRDYGAMIVKVQRGEDLYVQPQPDTILREGDVIWVVGDPAMFDRMK